MSLEIGESKLARDIRRFKKALEESLQKKHGRPIADALIMSLKRTYGLGGIDITNIMAEYGLTNKGQTWDPIPKQSAQSSIVPPMIPPEVVIVNKIPHPDPTPIKPDADGNYVTGGH